MTKVLLQCDSEGCLLLCRAEGHAGYAKSGSDIVCSAVSAVLRTTLQVLSESAALELEVNSEKPGFLSFGVKVKTDSKTSEVVNLLKYSGKFIESGIGSIAEDYPEYVKLIKM